MWQSTAQQSRAGAAPQAVDTIHQQRIVHSDLKPANFLVVEGQLKLIDFGIAKAIKADTTSIARDCQVLQPRAGGPPARGTPSPLLPPPLHFFPARPYMPQPAL